MHFNSQRTNHNYMAMETFRYTQTEIRSFFSVSIISYQTNRHHQDLLIILKLLMKWWWCNCLQSPDVLVFFLFAIFFVLVHFRWKSIYPIINKMTLILINLIRLFHSFSDFVFFSLYIYCGILILILFFFFFLIYFILI